MKANYLASPPLVVAYALAGRIDIDLTTEPLGTDQDGSRRLPARPLADAGRRSQDVVADAVAAGDVPAHVRRRLHGRRALARARPFPRASCTTGTTTRRTFGCRRTSRTWRRTPGAIDGRRGRTRARPWSATASRPTTSRPAGAIKPDSPAGKYLIEHGVEPQRLQLVRLTARQPRGDGARHVRERPPPQPPRPGQRGRRGRCTCPSGEEMTIYEASERYLAEGVPLMVHRRQGVRLGLLAATGRPRARGSSACRS